MINSKMYTPIKKYTPYVSSNNLSKRYLSCVDQLISSISRLGSFYVDQFVVNHISTAYRLLEKNDFNVKKLIDNYSTMEINDQSVEFFGDFNSLLFKIRFCGDKGKAALVFIDRVNYLLNQLSQSLGLDAFDCSYDQRNYKEIFVEKYQEVIFSLYEKGCRNFGNISLNNLNLSNKIFRGCFMHTATVDGANLDGTVFENCNLSFIRFTNAKSMFGMIIDKDCTLDLTRFESKLQLSNFKIKIHSSTNGIYYGNYSLNTRFDKLEEIEKQLSALTPQFKEMILDKSTFTDSFTAKYIDNRLKDEVIYTIYLECSISNRTFANKEDLEVIQKVCAITYDDKVERLKGCKNKIWLYDFSALTTWFNQNNYCPLKVDFANIKFYSIENIINLLTSEKEK